MNRTQKRGQLTLRRVSRSPSPVSRAVAVPAQNTETYTGLEVTPLLNAQGQVVSIGQNNAGKRLQSATLVPSAHVETTQNKNFKRNAPMPHHVHPGLMRAMGSRQLVKTRRRRNRRRRSSRRS
jgi:hypothetical protein